MKIRKQVPTKIDRSPENDSEIGLRNGKMINSEMENISWLVTYNTFASFVVSPRSTITFHCTHILIFLPFLSVCFVHTLVSI